MSIDVILACSLYENGMSVFEVATMLGVEPGSIYRKLRISDVQLRPRVKSPRTYVNATNKGNVRRDEAKTRLGGVCAKCGTTENLQFDHVDPGTKLFNISAGVSRRVDVFWAEVAKCQLLCQSHHEKKTNLEYSGVRRVNSRLRELDVKYIRELSRLGHSTAAIAREFEVATGTVRQVLVGVTWKHVPHRV